MLREYITEEEKAVYYDECSAVEDPSTLDWDKGESYLIGVLLIPNSKTKLEIWAYTFQIEDGFIEIVENLDIFKNAVEEIDNFKKPFERFLCYILYVGNILNGGTNRGQADGFQLEAISKFSSVKDNNNKTITYYINTLCRKEDENYSISRSVLENVSKASKSALTDIDSTIKKLKKGLSTQEDQFKKLKDEDLKFIEGATKKYCELKAKLEGFAKEVEVIGEKIKSQILFFGYTEKDNCFKKYESFFQIIYDCAGEIEKSMPKQEVKKVFKGKHIMGAKIMG